MDLELLSKEKSMKEKISSMAIVIAGEKNGKVLLLNSEGEWVFQRVT